MAQTSALQQLFSLIHGLFAGLNWVDYCIIGVMLFYAIEGYVVGFLGMLFDFFSFVTSFLFALAFYRTVAAVLVTKFSLPEGFANTGGFFLIAFLSEIVLNIVFGILHRYLQLRQARLVMLKDDSFLDAIDHLLGILPGLASACVLLLFTISLIVSLPVSPFLKQSITKSHLGTLFASHTQEFEQKLIDVFGGAVHDTLNFLTVEPDSNSSIMLHFRTTNVTVDGVSEQQMFAMVNKERTTRGLPELFMNDKLSEAALEHGKDMFARGYFSHYTPEGLSPFDRMSASGISFQAAGENLALAPNVDLAMQGLMQSPGHRANILSVDFGQVGIGVIDGGIYGEMFVQEFTN